jgi:hypothetical protein
MTPPRRVIPSFVTWYPVASTDTPPPTDTRILVWARGKPVLLGALCSILENDKPKPIWRHGSPNGRSLDFTPTYWSPMPEPPLDIV